MDEPIPPRLTVTAMILQAVLNEKLRRLEAENSLHRLDGSEGQAADRLDLDDDEPDRPIFAIR